MNDECRVIAEPLEIVAAMSQSYEVQPLLRAFVILISFDIRI